MMSFNWPCSAQNALKQAFWFSLNEQSTDNVQLSFYLKLGGASRGKDEKTAGQAAGGFF
jgi:hypothetical protein